MSDPAPEAGAAAGPSRLAPSLAGARGLRGFLRGAGYPLRGLLHLARERRAWRYAALPLAVHVAVFVVFAVAAILLVDDVFGWLRPDSLEQPVAALGLAARLGRWVLNGLLAAAAFGLAAGGAVLGGLLSAAVLSGPFNEKLSEVIEELATRRVRPDEPFSSSGLLLDAGRAIVSALQRLGLFLALSLPLLVLSFIPMLQLLAAAAGFAYTCYVLALNFLDPALDRQKLRLVDKLRWTRAVRAPVLGFGAAAFCLLLVPVANLLAAPGLVVAGTLFWLDAERPADEGSVTGSEGRAPG